MPDTIDGDIRPFGADSVQPCHPEVDPGHLIRTLPISTERRRERCNESVCSRQVADRATADDNLMSHAGSTARSYLFFPSDC